jgi:hypothetical protein
VLNADPIIDDEDDGNLDVLGTISKRGYSKLTSPDIVTPKPAKVFLNPPSEISDIELGVIPSAPTVTDSDFGSVYQTAAVYRDATKTSSLKLVKIGESVQVSIFTSIKSAFYFLSALIVITSLVVLIITIITLKSEGTLWMKSTEIDLNNKQMENLAAIAGVKSIFTSYYFLQIMVDLRVTARFVKNILSGDYHDPQQDLTSYSLDLFSTHVSPVDSSTLYSGFFLANSDIITAESKNTSLFDIKYRSLLYNDSLTSIVQYASESNGYFRSFPYKKSAYSNPTSCTIQDTTDPTCASLYSNSKCSDSLAASYPKYDPRCRLWYQFGKSQSNLSDVHVMYPRYQLTSGKYVVTSVMKILLGSEFFGVINSNSLVEDLSNAVNQLKILDHGYSYIIDAKNTSNLIMHPTSQCGRIVCAEMFNSDTEYYSFQQSILLPIERIATTGLQEPVSDSYVKDGSVWRLSYSLVQVGSICYAVVTTVPNDDITASSRKVQKSIDITVTNIIIAFAICLSLFGLILIYFSRLMVREIVDPINELRRIASLLAHDDLSSAVPTNSSSLDMKILLDAFSKLVVALRFGNENYSRGNLAIARSVYDDALKLFSNTGNVKGLGACHNNLGAVELSSASFAKSENHYNRAIEYCEKAILDSKSPEETKRLRRTLSDRKGNLAVLYLDRKDILSNNLTIAFDMIEKLLIEDKKRCTLIFFLFSAHSHFFIFIAGIYEDV